MDTFYCEGHINQRQYNTTIVIVHNTTSRIISADCGLVKTKIIVHTTELLSARNAANEIIVFF